MRLRSSTESMSGASRTARPGGNGVRGHQLQGVRVGGRRRHPLEVGQQPVRAEPVRVVGVVHQHRRAGGRSEHAGRGHPRADQRVDQGGLAGAGRAADHGEHRRLEGHQPRDHVVLELGDHLGLRGALLVHARGLQRQPCGAQRPRSRTSAVTIWVESVAAGRVPWRGSCAPVIGWVPPVRGTRSRVGPPRSGRRTGAPAPAKSGGGVPRRYRWCRKPELDGRLLVVPHRPLGLRAAVLPGPRAALAPGGRGRRPSRCRWPAAGRVLRGVGQRGREHPALRASGSTPRTPPRR